MIDERPSGFFERLIGTEIWNDSQSMDHKSRYSGVYRLLRAHSKTGETKAELVLMTQCPISTRMEMAIIAYPELELETEHRQIWRGEMVALGPVWAGIAHYRKAPGAPAMLRQFKFYAKGEPPYYWSPGLITRSKLSVDEPLAQLAVLKPLADAESALRDAAIGCFDALDVAPPWIAAGPSDLPGFTPDQAKVVNALLSHDSTLASTQEAFNEAGRVLQEHAYGGNAQSFFSATVPPLQPVSTTAARDAALEQADA